MERDFNSDDFEQFLQHKTEQYKIYPSEKSWKKIYNALHPGRSWFRIGGSLLLLTGFFFVSHRIFYTNTDQNNTHTKTAGTSINITNKGLNTQSSINSNTGITSSKKPGVMRLGELEMQNAQHQFTTEETVKTARLIHTAKSINAYSQTGRSLLNANVINTESTLSRLVIPGSTSDVTTTPPVDEVEDITIETASSSISDESPSSKALTPIRLTQSRKSKLDLQFYFSPTISYRRLADNKYGNSSQRNIPLASNYLNINRFVDHNPSIGAEFGSNVLWKAGRNFTIKSGLQLNYSRYTIKAYKFYFEKASIALNPVGRTTDTLTSYTSFRNFSGYSPEVLQNQYLQVSVPIGAELKIIGNKRLQLNVAGTIQPSYLLFNDTYLLSTDYVNYAKEPSLIQKWNIHTSFETFISYNVGGVRWQVGPQFRYQMLSTYNDRYPIKEYLMEYGVKVGVSKTLK